MKKRLSAFALVALFASFILPRGLLHDCAGGHSRHGNATDHSAPEVDSACAICSIGVPALDAVVVPAVAFGEADIPPPVAVTVTYWCAAPVPAQDGRGPPTSC